MKRLSGVFLAVAMLGAGACGGGGDTGKAKEIVDKLCACTTQACMDALKDEGMAFGKTLKDKYAKKEDVPKDLMDEMDRGDKCRRDLRDKLKAAAPAPTPTPTPAPAPTNAPSTQPAAP